MTDTTDWHPLSVKPPRNVRLLLTVYVPLAKKNYTYLGFYTIRGQYLISTCVDERLNGVEGWEVLAWAKAPAPWEGAPKPKDPEGLLS